MTARTPWIAILMTTFACAPAAAGVFVADKEWRQLTETTNFTWYEIQAACPTVGAPCSGSAVRASNGTSVDVDGWYWATNADVREMLDAVVEPGITNFTGDYPAYGKANDPDIQRMLSGGPTWFEPTSIHYGFRELDGRTSASATAHRIWVSDAQDAGANDRISTLQDTASARYPTLGFWLYRPACSGPQLKTFTLSSALVAGCKSVTGRITLCSSSATSLVVSVGDTLAAATPPATVTIAAGTTTRSFAIKTAPVTANQSGKVSVSLAGRTLEQPLALRPMGLLSVTVAPSTIVGSQPAVGTAKLECKAGPGPIEVKLSSNNAAVAAPVATSVVVPQALQSATFDVTTRAVLARSYATISGTANGITKTKKLTVNPAAAVAPTSLKFGSVAVGTTSVTQTATLSNKGTAAIAVQGIAITGTSASWFVLASNICPASLAAGATCTVGLRFKPVSALTKSAKLEIRTSATSLPLGVALSGTGVTQ
jgi:hypothetical protein